MSLNNPSIAEMTITWKLLLVAAFLGTSSWVVAVEWNGNNWAMGCDFTGNDLSNARIPGEQCGGKCAETSVGVATVNFENFKLSLMRF